MGKKIYGDEFWDKVAEYRDQGLSWYKISKLTGVSAGYLSNRKERVEKLLLDSRLRKIKKNKRQKYKPPGAEKKVTVKPHHLKIIRLASACGYTLEEIAELIGVHCTTLHRYRKQNPQIDEEIKLGKEYWNIMVQRAVLKRAVGMNYKETKLATFQGQFFDEKEIDVYLPPDMKAAEMWLVNKAGWRRANDPEAVKGIEDKKGKILEWIDEQVGEDEDE